MPISSRRLRAPAQIDSHINRRIHRQMMCRLEYFARHPEEIGERLRELDREWDVERVLQANAASLSLFGLVMALLRGRHYLLVPITVAGFLLQHALQGWCRPLAIFRWLEIRTRNEIAVERQALKILRGDFDNVRHDVGAERATAAVSR